MSLHGKRLTKMEGQKLECKKKNAKTESLTQQTTTKTLIKLDQLQYMYNIKDGLCLNILLVTLL